MPREIVSLWATRKSEDYGPELLTAWDEFSIDENLDGFRKACVEAMNAMGDDLDQYRYITVYIDDADLDEAFSHVVRTTAQIKDTTAEHRA